MIIRAITLTILLAAVLGWFVLEQKKGTMRQADEWFLDFLVANVRDSLSKNMPDESNHVVLVEFREEDKAEYSTWPPAPIDYRMILKAVADHEPPVLAVVEPLRWEKAEFINELRESLTRFPWVIHGYHIATDGAAVTPEQSEFAANEMTALPAAEGDQQDVPKFSRVSKLSDWTLRIATQAGFTSINGAAPSGDSIPFVASDRKRLVPSLAAQAVTLFRFTPYVAQRLRFGRGARLSLGDNFIIPLRDDGSLMLSDKPHVPSVNALELMTLDLGDDTSKAVQDTLGKGKVVVLGNGPGGMIHARAIATALAMPQIRRAGEAVMWAFTGSAVLFCVWQLRHRRMKALLAGISAFIAGLAVCLLVFQSSLLWWSPLPALLVIVTSTAFCFIWPASNPAAPPPAVAVTDAPASPPSPEASPPAPPPPPV